MLFLLLAALAGLCMAGSMINVATFTDIECNVPSTTSQNVSIPLDACITTIGMESFHYAATPCAGGGAVTVQNYGYSDGHCMKSSDFGYTNYGGGCYGTYKAGSAFGSIMLTCKASSSNPQPDGTTTTINVGPVATDSASETSTASSTSSTSNSSTSSSTTGSTSGWNSLSLGERIGIIVALAVGIPPILIGLRMLNSERRKRHERTLNEELGTPPQHGWPELTNELRDMGSGGIQSPPPAYGSQQNFPKYDHNYAQPSRSWSGNVYVNVRN